MATTGTITAKKIYDTDTVLNTRLETQVRKFITDNRAGALGTADEDGMPQVAFVYVLVSEDLNIYFSTRTSGRKFRNLFSSPKVSMAFYDEPNMATVQLNGLAERIDDVKCEQEILLKLIELRSGEPVWPIPPIKMFVSGAANELAIIKVTPKELTYGSFTTSNSGKYKPFFEKVI